MHKLYCISPVQTGIDFLYIFLKIACGALRVKQVAVSDVTSCLLPGYAVENAKLVLATPFHVKEHAFTLRLVRYFTT